MRGAGVGVCGCGVRAWGVVYGSEPAWGVKVGGSTVTGEFAVEVLCVGCAECVFAWECGATG